MNYLQRVFARTWYVGVIIIWSACMYVFFLPLLRWSILDAVWVGTAQRDCHSQGACWLYVYENVNNFMYGTYPRAEVWRIHVVFALVAAYAVLALYRIRYTKLLASSLVVIPLSWYTILYGAWTGLALVPTSYWGGFSLNLILSMVIVVMSLPVGLLLALARQSSWPVVHVVSRVLIDVMRSLPLVTVLFFASMVSVYFMHPDYVVDKFVRISFAGILFGSAYMAEAIRGGLQAVGIEQEEVALSLGIGTVDTYRFVLLPQAFRVAFPSLMNIAIALFKDTTLVSSIAMMDVLAIMQSTTANATWMAYFVEGYVFVAVLFWCGSTLLAYFGTLGERSVTF